jgi:hypothetical protein
MARKHFVILEHTFENSLLRRALWRRCRPDPGLTTEIGVALRVRWNLKLDHEELVE